MTDQPHVAPVLSETEVAQISETALKNAQERIEAIIDGNGVHKSAVRISEKGLAIEPLTLDLKVKISFSDQETRTSGNTPTGIVITGKEALAEAQETSQSEILNDPAFQASLYQSAKGAYFALNGEKIQPLKDQQSQYSYAEECITCKGKGQSTCTTCKGAKESPCSNCGGRGNMMCLVCKGLKKLTEPDGSKKSCYECSGFGFTHCPQCRGSKQIPCKTCNKTGTIICADCNKTGKQSVVITSTAQAHINGKLIPTGQMEQTLQDVISQYSEPELVKSGHIAFDVEHGQSVAKNGLVHWTIPSYVPYGDVAFSLNGKRIDAKIFGINGLILTKEMFLDSMIKAGIGALNKIAKGPMATSALFEQARSFKIIRDVTNKISRESKKKILKDLMNEYPIGLSEKYARAIVSFSDQALRKIMIKPRWIGAGVGAALGAVLLFAWFHLGIRPETLQKGSLNFQLFTDATLVGGMMVLTSFIIKFLTQMSLKNILGEAPSKLPKAGDQALIAGGLLLVIFLAMAATATVKPAWWTQFF